MKAGAGVASRINDAMGGVLGSPPGSRPTLCVTPQPGNLASVYEVTVRVGHFEHRFVAGWAGSGWRPDVERLMAVVTVQVVFATSLSDEAKDWLRTRGIGWVDETGSANISLATGLLVVRDGSRITPPVGPGDGWTKSMVAAAEAILAGVLPTVEEVESAASISRGASASALSRLETRGILDRPGPKRGRGVARSVVDVDKLIDEYAEAAGRYRSKQKVIRLHCLWADPMRALASEVGPALTSEPARWAVTGPAASTLLAPYLGEVTTLDLYVDHTLFAAPDRLSALLGGRVVDRGHRIEVRELPTSMSAAGPKIDDITVALPARVYADLIAVGGRASEAAHHLREVRGVGPRS
ncbi:MAG: hypothetical protein NVS3B21_29400 [Acidimicrobiales bacterium]